MWRSSFTPAANRSPRYEIPQSAHRRLEQSRHSLAPSIAVILCRFRLALLPARPLEFQRLHRTAMRVRHVIAALVERLERPLDRREAAYRVRRQEGHFARAPEPAF